MGILTAEQHALSMQNRQRHYLGEEIPNMSYKKIGQVARELNVHPSKIRYLEAYFRLEGKTNLKGERLFTPDQVSHLRRIIAVTSRTKLSFAKQVVKAGLLGEYMALINRVAEKNLSRS